MITYLIQPRIFEFEKKNCSQPTVYVDVVFRFEISIMFPSGFDLGRSNDPVHLQGIQHWPVK